MDALQIPGPTLSITPPNTEQTVPSSIPRSRCVYGSIYYTRGPYAMQHYTLKIQTNKQFNCWHRKCTTSSRLLPMIRNYKNTPPAQPSSKSYNGRCALYETSFKQGTDTYAIILLQPEPGLYTRLVTSGPTSDNYSNVMINALLNPKPHLLSTV